MACRSTVLDEEQQAQSHLRCEHMARDLSPWAGTAILLRPPPEHSTSQALQTIQPNTMTLTPNNDKTWMLLVSVLQWTVQKAPVIHAGNEWAYRLWGLGIGALFLWQNIHVSVLFHEYLYIDTYAILLLVVLWQWNSVCGFQAQSFAWVKVLACSPKSKNRRRDRVTSCLVWQERNTNLTVCSSLFNIKDCTVGHTETDGLAPWNASGQGTSTVCRAVADGKPPGWRKNPLDLFRGVSEYAQC